MTFVLSMVNLSTLIDALVNKTDQTESYARIRQDVLDKGTINLAENKMKLFIATINVPPSIGEWILTVRNPFYSKTKIQFEKCDDEFY